MEIAPPNDASDAESGFKDDKSEPALVGESLSPIGDGDSPTSAAIPDSLFFRFAFFC